MLVTRTVTEIICEASFKEEPLDEQHLSEWQVGDNVEVGSIAWIVPPPSNSHHQDYAIFCIF